MFEIMPFGLVCPLQVNIDDSIFSKSKWLIEIGIGSHAGGVWGGCMAGDNSEDDSRSWLIFADASDTADECNSSFVSALCWWLFLLFGSSGSWCVSVSEIVVVASVVALSVVDVLLSQSYIFLEKKEKQSAIILTKL